MRSNNEIIELIDILRKEKQLSISELARRVGMAKSALSRYFNKTREFPLNKVEDFANVLGVSSEYILGFEKNESKEQNSSIDQIYKKLNEGNQKEVYSFAQAKLDEQNNNIVRMPTREEMTLAAHSADPNKIFTKEEIQKIHDYLDELDAEYDRKHGINKNDDK